MGYSVSVYQRGDNYAMRFRCHGQSKRHNVSLGPLNAKIAEKVRGHMDQLLRRQQCPEVGVPDSTIQWIKEQSAELQKVLGDANLVPGKPPGKSLREHVREFINLHTGKDSTKDQLEVVGRSLMDYFGADRDINSINLQDAIAYRSHLLKEGGAFGRPMADNTVRRYVGRSRQMLGILGEANPFKDKSLPVSVGHDESKDCFVEQAVIEDVLAAAGSAEWRVAIALARFAGFRACEIPALTWEGIDWERGSITVDSPKTGRRVLPLFVDLRPYLEELRDSVAEATGPVITSYDGRRSSLDAMRVQLGKIVDRSGHPKWPKIWQNLRATRETELLTEGYPLKSVTKWLGNSKLVAMKHYVMALESDFQKAAGLGAVTRVTGSVTAAVGEDRKPAETRGGESANSQRLRGDFSMKTRLEREASYPARDHKSAEIAGSTEPQSATVTDGIESGRTASDEGTDYWSKLEEAVDGCCRAFQARKMRVSDLRDAIDILSSVPGESLEAAVRLVKANGWWIK